MLVNKKVDSLIAEVKADIENQKARLSDLQQLLANLQKFGTAPPPPPPPPGEKRAKGEKDVRGGGVKKSSSKRKVKRVRAKGAKSNKTKPEKVAATTKMSRPPYKGRRRGRPLKNKELKQNLLQMLEDVSPKAVDKYEVMDWLRSAGVKTSSTNQCGTYLEGLFREGRIEKIRSGRYKGKYYTNKTKKLEKEYNTSLVKVVKRGGIEYVIPEDSSAPVKKAKKQKAPAPVAPAKVADAPSSSITNRVKAALKHYASKEEFEISQVMNFIKQKFSTQYSGAQVAGALRRLCSKGKIKRVRIGVYTAKI